VCIHLSDDLVIGFSFSFSQRVYSKTESPVFIMPWYATEFSMLIHPIGVESRHLIVILGISPNILLGLFDHSFGPDNVDGSSIRVVITNILHCICREDYIFGTNESPSIYRQLQISWEWTHPLAKGYILSQRLCLFIDTIHHLVKQHHPPSGVIAYMRVHHIMV
jgi:hypothetical protein